MYTHYHPIYFKKIILAFSLIFVVSILIGQETAQLTKAQMEEDLAKLEQQMFKVHPGLDFYESSRNLSSIFTTVRQSLPEKATPIEFLLHIAPVIDATKCGHTGFNIKTYKKKKGSSGKDLKGLFPLHLKLVEGATFVKKNLSNDTLLVKDKMQVLSINGIPIDEVLLTLANINLGSDGNNRLGEINFIVKYFLLAYHMFYGPQEQFEVELLNLYNNETTIVKLKASSLKELSKFRLERYPGTGIPPIQVRLIDGMAKTAVLDVNTFSSSRWDVFQLGYSRKMKKIFKFIKEQDIEYLILDLRNNPGGIVENVVRLMKYTFPEPFVVAKDVSINRNYFKSKVKALKKTGIFFRRKNKRKDNYELKQFSGKRFKPKKRNHFDGMMVVLIDEGSFSAACTFALHAKSSNRAILIGEEAGGSYHIVSAGDSYNCKLKNADLSVRIPIMLYEYNVNPDLQDKLNGVVPTIIKRTKIEDFMNGRDTQLQAAADIIKMHKSK